MKNYRWRAPRRSALWSGVLAVSLLTLLAPLGWSDNSAPPFTGQAVFLLDTSLSAYPQRFNDNVKELHKLLESEQKIKHFNILTFDVAGRWVEPKAWLENNAAGRAKVLERLKGHLLEGATDLGAALDQLAKPGFDIPKETTVLVYLLSDGHITWGESDVKALGARFLGRTPFPARFICYPFMAREGVNQELFKALEALPQAAQDPGKAAGGTARTAFGRFLAKVDPQVKLLEGKNGEHVKQLLKLLNDEDFELPTTPLGAHIPRTADVPQAYLQARDIDRRKIAIYLEEAARRAQDKDPPGAARALSSVAEVHATNCDVLRSVGYRLLDGKQPAHAARLFERVQALRPLEPHSYRDLARSLEDAGKYGLAAIHYEIVMAGTWNAKFTDSLKEVVLEEYAHMMRDAIRRKAVSSKLMNHFGERLEGVDAKKLQADLRVTISWNTDDTDVDLWVIEPDGTKCFFAHRKTKNGGELTQDVTQGYGPERYQMVKATPGEYAIKVHYYSGPRNPQIAETHVNVVVRRDAGTPQETSQRYTVILRIKGDLVDVCTMKF